VFTHITARVPGVKDQFLINPYGLMFDEVTASSLVKVGVAGEKLDDAPFPVNPAGFVIHSAVHSARHDAQCVLHVHSLNGAAVSAQRNGVLPISQQSMFVLASLAYHDYEGVALNEEEKPRLVADLGNKTFLMLRNHGLLTVGTSIADAFLAMYIFEAACNIQIRAQSGGASLSFIPPELIAGAQAQAAAATHSLGGKLVWPGLLRMLDGLDGSYAT
jgi:ribulose-5-phosphate 4-epimerase/fuculose-1-phosphate aldolase